MADLPELGGSGGVAKLEDNPWVGPIAGQLRGSGSKGVLEYIGGSEYRAVYNRQHSSVKRE